MRKTKTARELSEWDERPLGNLLRSDGEPKVLNQGTCAHLGIIEYVRDGLKVDELQIAKAWNLAGARCEFAKKRYATLGCGIRWSSSSSHNKSLEILLSSDFDSPHEDLTEIERFSRTYELLLDICLNKHLNRCSQVG